MEGHSETDVYRIWQNHSLPRKRFLTPAPNHHTHTLNIRCECECTLPPPPLQGYVEATPEHPLEAASAAAFASSLASGSGGSSDNGNDDGGSLGGANSRTFVTQANTAAARAGASRSTLGQLSERDIGGAEGGGGRGGGSGGFLTPPSLFGGTSHEPQAPSIV